MLFPLCRSAKDDVGCGAGNGRETVKRCDENNSATVN